MKATKTWRDMLNESLEDPNFEVNGKRQMQNSPNSIRSLRHEPQSVLRRQTLPPEWEPRNPRWRAWRAI